MTNQVQILPSLPKDNYNIISANSSLFKPVPIRKKENNLSFPVSTKTNSPNSTLIYPNFGFGSYSTFNFNSLGNLQNYLLTQDKKIKLDIKNKPCCNCIKTKCMKKYCECFANNKLCKNCVCSDCKNKTQEISPENKENVSLNKDSKAIFCTLNSFNSQLNDFLPESHLVSSKLIIFSLSLLHFSLLSSAFKQLIHRHFILHFLFSL